MALTNDEADKLTQINFFLQSNYGVFEREPFVSMTIQIGDMQYLTRFAAEGARALAFNLLETAEAAEMDGMVFEFLCKRLDQDPNTAAHILNDLREFRAPGQPPLMNTGGTE